MSDDDLRAAGFNDQEIQHQRLREAGFSDDEILQHQVGVPKDKLGIGDYALSRAISTPLEEGSFLSKIDVLSNPFSYTSGANPVLTPTAQAELSRPNPADAVNQSIFGIAQPKPEGAAARYAGAVAGGFTANPFLSVNPAAPIMAPVTTVTSSLGSQLFSDLADRMPDLPPGLRAAAPVIGGAIAGGLTQGGKSLLAGSAVNRAASSLGESTSLQQAGTELQSAARGLFDDPAGAGSMTSEQFKQVIKGHAVSKIISTLDAGEETLRPEDVASKLLAAGRRGGTDLAKLREIMPDAVDELAAAHLRTNPQGWAKLSPEAQEALVPDRLTRRRLDFAASKTPIHSIGIEKQLRNLFLGGGVGGVGGIAGGFDPASAALIGEVAGWAIPQAFQSGRNVLANPAILGPPAQGALVGKLRTVNPDDVLSLR